MSDPVPLIKKIEERFLRKDPLPEFRPGDTVRVQVKIREGEKERLQAFDGVVIRRARGGNRASFTVRKVSYGVGVERVFAENSPNIAGVEVLSRGKVRQSRLYFLRGLSGKAARIKERTYDKAAQAEKDKKVKKRGRHRKQARAEEAPAKTADRAKQRRQARRAAKKAKPKAKAEKKD